MKRLLFLLVMALALGSATRAYSDGQCGQDGLSCTDGEVCCEHVIATFAGEQAATPPFITGRCLPPGQKCGEFWCGNEECKSSFFGTPSVCCINTPNYGAAPEYACRYSELSCPGNSQNLTIRDTQPARTLRRG